jgi:hypothetical protein
MIECETAHAGEKLLRRETVGRVACSLPKIRHLAGRAEELPRRSIVSKVVIDGLKHGYFDYSIACEVGNGGKRQLVIRAGKSHKFTILADEVPRGRQLERSVLLASRTPTDDLDLM